MLGYAFVRPESEQNCSLLGSVYDRGHGNQTRIHRGSALRFDAAFQLLRSHGGLADTLRLQVSLAELRTFPGGPMTHHGRWSTSSSTLGWQMRECPLSWPSRNGAPAPRPPRRWPGLFISARDDRSSITLNSVCGPGPIISLIPPKALVVVDSRQSGPPSLRLIGLLFCGTAIADRLQLAHQVSTVCAH
jgi:hypothetical protein